MSGIYPNGAAPNGAGGVVSNVTPPADTTNPVLPGSITLSSVTQTTAHIVWSAATDDVAVAGYQYSIDTGTPNWQNTSATSADASGLTPSTNYTVRVRALDTSSNYSNVVTTPLTTLAVVGDTTPPVLSGSITTSSVTATSAHLSWPAATDNVAVTGYRYSVDTGSPSWTNATSLFADPSGLTPSTNYTVRVQAFDAAGNYSNILTAALTTSAPPQTGDTTAPIAQGGIEVSAITQTTAHIVWPAFYDNVAVTGYQFSQDTGIANWVNIGLVTSRDLSSLTPATDVTVRVRAYDAAGNLSNPVTRSFTTLANTTTPGIKATRATIQLVNTADAARTNLSGLKWSFFDQSPGQMLAPTAQGLNGVTDGSGNFVANITGTNLAPGAAGWLIVTDSDGTLIAFGSAMVFAGMVGVT